MTPATETDHLGELVLQDMQTAATTGNLPALKEVLARWHAAMTETVDADGMPADLRWLVPTMAEKLLSHQEEGSYRWLALQRVRNSAAKEGNSEAVAYLLDC